MTLFVVTEWDADERTIVGAFTKRADAETYITQLRTANDERGWGMSLGLMLDEIDVWEACPTVTVGFPESFPEELRSKDNLHLLVNGRDVHFAAYVG